MSHPIKTTRKFEFSQDMKTEWHWRLVADKKVSIVADSGKWYKVKHDAVYGINLIKGTTISRVVWEQKPDGPWT